MYIAQRPLYLGKDERIRAKIRKKKKEKFEKTNKRMIYFDPIYFSLVQRPRTRVAFLHNTKYTGNAVTITSLECTPLQTFAIPFSER